MMNLFNVILQDSDASFENAVGVCMDGALLQEAGSDPQCKPTHSRPEGMPINGVQIWYDYGADYYFFEDLEYDYV